MGGTTDIFHDGMWAMGTRLDIVLTGIPRDTAAALCEQAFRRIRDLETTLSRFLPDGETGRLNRHAGAAPVEAGPVLWKLLLACRRFHRDTGGSFDIAQTPSLRWHRLPENERTEAGFRDAREASGMDRIVFDDANRTVRFAHPATEVDFGAVGKGFALDEIRPLLAEAGVENALVSFGESSVLAMGRHPYGDRWEIGIRHPVTDEAVRTVGLRDGALSVSGLRRVAVDGVSELQGHIVEPGAGHLVARPSTVAVTSASALEAEALSTAWIASGEDDPVFFKNFPGTGLLAVDAGKPDPVFLS